MKATRGCGGGFDGRGVFVAPWHGENGELVLLAITSSGLLACDPVTVPNGASRVEAADALTALLDRVDPDRRPVLKVI